MTRNQLQYHANMEIARSNRARELETNRANMAKETEDKRSNLAREAEENRSNIARETETNRANLVNEAETARHQQRIDRSTTARNIVSGITSGIQTVTRGFKDVVDGAKGLQSMGVGSRQYSIF